MLGVGVIVVAIVAAVTAYNSVVCDSKETFHLAHNL